MQSSNPYNLEVKRIGLFTWIYGMILVITISTTILSRSLQNQTDDDFQHPWYQTWFYCLAKCLCIIIIFHPDYNTTYGLSPPHVLFPVSAAAFVSAPNQEIKKIQSNKRIHKQSDVPSCSTDNEHAIEMDESVTDDNIILNEKRITPKQKVNARKKQHISVPKYDNNNNNKNCIDMRAKSRPFTWNMFFKQQCIYFIFSILTLFGELFLNISLYYISASTYIMLFPSLLIIFASVYQCVSGLKKISRIYHLVGLLFLFVGVIIISLSCFAEMKDTTSWDTNEIIFALLAVCIACIFISLYLTVYQYLYEKWNLYWRLCLTLKNQSVALSSVPPSKRENIGKLYVKFNNVRWEQERKLIFIHWNHIKFIFMEGVYGVVITSVMILCENMFMNSSDNIVFYDDFAAFLSSVQSNCVYFILIFIFIISTMFYEIILEDSRYHLSPYHSRIIYVLSIIFVWCCNLLLHYVTADEEYGQVLSWYNLIQLMGLLFIIGGLLIHDDKYVVFVNKMIEHNDTIKEQYKLFKLHEYWNNVYFNREKSRLLGHSPQYLVPGYQSDTEYSIISKSLTQYHFEQKNNRTNKNQEYQNQNEDIDFLSIQTRDDGNLKGAMSLLLGKDMNDSFCNKPSKYYPSFYE